MKKTLYIIIFISLSILVLGQTGPNDFADIQGRVMTNGDGKLKSLPIKNAEVILNSLDSSIVTNTMTNDSGYYSFKIRRKYSKINLRVLTTAFSSIQTKQKYSFLGNNEKTVLDITNTNYVKDFYLTPYIPDISPPSLLFKSNSTEMYWDKADIIWGDTPPEDAILYYAKMLKDNPKITVLITGYCDTKEKRPKCLPSKRAKFIKAALIKAGIEKKRIATKGGMTKRLYVSDEIINNAPTNEEKELLHQKNRRAKLTILTFGDD